MNSDYMTNNKHSHNITKSPQTWENGAAKSNSFGATMQPQGPMTSYQVNGQESKNIPFRPVTNVMK